MSENAEQQPIQTETEVAQESQPAQAGSESQAQPEQKGSQQGNEVQPPQMIPKWRFDEVNEQLKAERLARLQAQPAQPQKPSQPVEDGKPKPEAFQTYEEYIDARAAYVARQEHLRARQEEQQQSQVRSFEDRVKKADESFNEKLFEATTKNPALIQKLQNAPTLRADLQLYGLKEADQPIALAEHLADNPGLVLQLNQMPPERALREMGKIEAKLNGSSVQAQPKVSQMPKPMAPVGTGKATGGDGEMNLSKALSLLYPS